MDLKRSYKEIVLRGVGHQVVSCINVPFVESAKEIVPCRGRFWGVCVCVCFFYIAGAGNSVFLIKTFIVYPKFWADQTSGIVRVCGEGEV